ncbi:hypothetical protein [Mucilaginibacter pedocola]|nr:hypothetical protein [Mucilaginibacter pedocola]
MLLNTSCAGIVYSFECIPLSDEPNEKLFFFVQIIGGDSMLLEKGRHRGMWTKVKGGNISKEMQEAICLTIDNTNAIELWKNIMPLNEFDVKG